MIEGAPHTSPLVAARSRDLEMSAIKEMAIRSARVPDAVSLAWGLPSFQTPEPIRAAVERALRDDPSAGMYTLPAGLPELRMAVAETHAQRTGRHLDPERHVAITAGNMEGINTLLHVLVDPGDEVIVTDPGFVSHIQQIRMNGGRPVYWPMDEAAGWRLDPADLAARVTPRTKAILLVNPTNPTGTVIPEETLRAAAEIARDKGIFVILDDPYSAFVYDDRERLFDLCRIPEYSDVIVYLFTFSKAYAMSGWRVGYMITPEALIGEIVKMHDLAMICTPRVSQIGAIAALREKSPHLDEFRRILGRRRDLICERLNRLPHVFEYVRPDGAYYVFPRIVGEEQNSVRFAHTLLDDARVTVTPGSAFGPGGEGHVRMAYCVAEDQINLAFDRLEARFGTA